MSLFTGKITKSIVNKSRRFVKFIGMGRDDVKEHRAAAPWGDESVPIKDAVAIWANTSVSGEAVVVGYINTSALEDLNPGERRIFSTNDTGTLQVYARFTDAGKLELNGDADNLVRYSELKTAFDQLRTDLNALTALYNAHVHPSLGSPTPSVSTPSTADMTASKIDELQTS